MLSILKKGGKLLQSKFYWGFMFLTLIIILVFNDVFGNDDWFIVVGLIYFMVLTISFILAGIRQIKSILTLKKEKAQMEMQHLKSQVNPHFFFNTLNNLYGTVEKNPKQAQEMILKLSDLMRYSIYEGQHEWVSLEEEINYLNNYISLHQERYHKNVNIDFKTEIGDGQQKIMPLMLILLVENSFKHGVEKLRNDAYIHIELKANKTKIEFKITNNFDPEEVSDKEEGIGITNLKRRLEIGYPKKHKLIFSKQENVFVAYLALHKT